MEDTPEVVHSMAEPGTTGDAGSCDGTEEECQSSTEAHEAEMTREVPSILENMNAAAEDVNRLEQQLGEARALRQRLLDQWSHLYEDIHTQHGRILNRVGPYLKAWERVQIARQRVTSLTGDYGRAVAMHDAAKTDLACMEQALERQGSLSQDQQDALAQGTIRVFDLQKVRDGLEKENTSALKECKETAHALKKAKSDVGESTIRRALPFIQKLQQHQAEITRVRHQCTALVNLAAEAKERYNGSLRQLDDISAEVHEYRRVQKEKARLKEPEPKTEATRRKASERLESVIAAAKAAAPEVSPELDSDVELMSLPEIPLDVDAEVDVTAEKQADAAFASAKGLLAVDLAAEPGAEPHGSGSRRSPGL